MAELGEMLLHQPLGGQAGVGGSGGGLHACAVCEHSPCRHVKLVHHLLLATAAGVTRGVEVGHPVLGADGLHPDIGDHQY